MLTFQFGAGREIDDCHCDLPDVRLAVLCANGNYLEEH
jgi:hypothetical protein